VAICGYTVSRDDGWLAAVNDDLPPSAHRRRWVERRHHDLTADHGVRRWRRGLFRGSTPHTSDWHTRHWTSRGLHRVEELAANAATGVTAAALIAGWVVFGVAEGFPIWWATALYVATGSVTFVMVFVIQHTQSRQNTALQRKLDELVRATHGADDRLIAVEEAPDEELQARADLNVHDRIRATGGRGTQAQ